MHPLPPQTFDVSVRCWSSAVRLLVVCAGSILVAQGASGQGTITLSSLNLTPNDNLPVLIGGTVPDAEHDVYQIINGAVLEGRLDLRLINNYTPMPGDTIDFLQAAFIEQQFRSHFFPEPLPDDVAVEFRQSQTNLQAAFVNPQFGNDFVVDVPITLWNNPANWAFGEVPNSTDVTLLQNNGADSLQRVRVIGGPATGQAPAAVHEIAVAGDLLPMVLEVVNDAHFSASLRASVGNKGSIELNGGSLIANKVIVEPLGRIAIDQGRIVSGSASTDVEGLLTGSGEIVGALHVLDGGTLDVDPGAAPGWGEISVTGNYTQTVGGQLSLDVQSPVPGDIDTLTISGDATLDGVLQVDMTGFTSFNVGSSIDIITAGNIASSFASVVEFGRVPNGSYAAPVYNATTVSLVGYQVGDMNRDSMLDNDDVDLFILALRDRLAYEMTELPGGAVIGISADITGDIDYDGDLDFDDIQPFIESLEGSAAAYAAKMLLGIPIPEPSTAALLLIAGALCKGVRRQ